MTTRTVPDLKELFKQASEIAQQVPPNMQEAAFNRALDLLTGSTSGQTASADQGKATRKASISKDRSAPEDGAVSTEALLAHIDSTQHPGVTAAVKILDRALMVLKIVLDEHGIDGLSPSDIAKILTDKFRVSATAATVSTALGRATTLVNRVPNKGGYIYRIMAPGIEYLTGVSSPLPLRLSPSKGKSSRKKVASPANASATRLNAASEVQATPKKPSTSPARKSSKGLGPKSAILSLITDKFFDTPKTPQVVQLFLKTKRGYIIDTDQLRVALLRLVRDQILDREPNSDGSYEYKRR